MKRCRPPRRAAAAGRAASGRARTPSTARPISRLVQHRARQPRLAGPDRTAQEQVRPAVARPQERPALGQRVAGCRLPCATSTTARPGTHAAPTAGRRAPPSSSRSAAGACAPRPRPTPSPASARIARTPRSSLRPLDHRVVRRARLRRPRPARRAPRSDAFACRRGPSPPAPPSSLSHKPLAVFARACVRRQNF